MCVCDHIGAACIRNKILMRAILLSAPPRDNRSPAFLAMAPARMKNEVSNADLLEILKEKLDVSWSLDHVWMDEDADAFLKRYEDLASSIVEKTPRVCKAQVRNSILKLHSVPVDYADFFAVKLCNAFRLCSKSAKRDNFTGEKLTSPRKRLCLQQIKSTVVKTGCDPSVNVTPGKKEPPLCTEFESAEKFWNAVSIGSAEEEAVSMWSSIGLSPKKEIKSHELQVLTHGLRHEASCSMRPHPLHALALVCGLFRMSMNFYV